jgi:uncharacterized protein
MRQFAKLFVLQLLRGYKWAISPMFPPACRYVPTCSEYAMEAVERYGALRGGLRALLRLVRCHPFASGGYDPVPQGLKPDISDGLGGAAGSLALSRSKSPLLAKSARNGAPGGFHCGPPKIPNRVA